MRLTLLRCMSPELGPFAKSRPAVRRSASSGEAEVTAATSNRRNWPNPDFPIVAGESNGYCVA
jgi:hypothetical protein